MKKLMNCALLALVMGVVMLPVLAFAQVGDVPTMDNKTIVWMGATSVGSFLIGLAIKKWPVLDGYSNRLIPYTTCAIATVGFMVVLKLNFVDSLMLAGASAFGAVLLAEGPLKSLTKKPEGVQ